VHAPRAAELSLTEPQLAWVIAFIASIISAIRGGFPNFAWWTLVFMFFCIVGVTVTVASDAERTYHVAVRVDY
jgi:SHO1 osmosensor